MTDIKNDTIRRTVSKFVNYGADAKRIIVKLHMLGPHEALSLKLERRRTGQTILVADLYALLLRKAANAKQMGKARSKRKVARKFARLSG